MRKPLIILFIIWLVAVIWTCSGCTKDHLYIEHPTCYKYLELDSLYDGEMRFIRLDTLWPSTVIGSPAIACGNDTLKLINYLPHYTGCITGGFQKIYYQFINRKN